MKSIAGKLAGLALATALLGALAIGAGSASGAGCSTTWNGAAWSNGTPTSASDACIAGPLVLSGTPTWHSVTVQNGGALRIGAEEPCPGASDSLTLTAGGSVDPGGKLVVFSSSSCSEGGPGALDISGGTLTNNGELDLTNCTDVGGSTCSGGSRTVTGDVTNTATVNIDATNSSLQNGTFTNQGTINISDTSSGDAYYVDLSNGETLVNGGTIAIDPSSRLGLAANGDGTYEQGSGTVTGEPVTAQGGTIDIEGAGAASFVVSAPSTLKGDVRAGQSIDLRSTGNGCSPAGDLTASGSFTNAGTISLDQNNCTEAKLIIPSGDTMTNTGTITTLDCQCGGREIDGSIVNEGTLQFGDRTTLGGSGATFEQTSGTTTITNVVSISGGPGTLDLAGGTVTGVKSLYGPKLEGSIENSGGTIQQGADGATLQLAGNYTQEPGGTLGMLVGQGSQPAINVSGTATLDGTLDVQTPQGFNPDPNSTYPALDAGLVNGTFAGVNGQFPRPGVGYEVDYSQFAVTLKPATAHTLTVTRGGTGSGTVTSDPAGIDCGSGCSAQFLDGQEVTLTAAAAVGSSFSGWSGDCSGTAVSCQVAMSAERHVEATFKTSPRSAGTPIARLSAGSFSFDARNPGTPDAPRTATLTNVGSAPLAVDSVELQGAGASQYAITADDCASRSLAPAASCSVSVALDLSRSVPAGDHVSTAASLVIADNGATGGQQAVALVGPTVIAGFATGGTATPDPSTITACVDTGGGELAQRPPCTTSGTTADGSFVTAVQPGPLLVETRSGDGQVTYEPQSVQAPAGEYTRVDFTGHATVPLSDGVSFTSSYGTTTSGVPVIYASSPFSMRLPVPIPPTGDPSTTKILDTTAGFEFHDGAIPAYELTEMIMSARYGADGKLEGVAPPIVAQADCTAPAGGASPCASWFGSSPPTVADTDLRARVHSAEAHAAIACGKTAHVNTGPYVQETKSVPTADGGWATTYYYSDGHTETTTYFKVQLPKLAADSTGTEEVAYDIANAAIGITPVGWWNAWVGYEHYQTTGDTTAAYFTLGAQAVGVRFHGAASWVWNFVTGNAPAAGFNDPSRYVDYHPDFACPINHPVRVYGPIYKRGDMYIDPSGTVKTTTGAPVARAKVTLSRATAAGNPLLPVPNGSDVMSPSNRRNPDFTGQTGIFGWDVLPGSYQVSAQRKGCRARSGHGQVGRSAVLPVPPAQTGIRLVLRCPSLHRAATRLRATAIRYPGPVGGYDVTVRVRAARRSRHASCHGTVTLRAGGKSIASAAVSPKRGTVSLSVPIYTKLRTVRLSYSGDARWKPSRVTVRVRR